jgi:glutathione synthase/RimK-type ligase-like ATP-grasp enzyme
MRRCAFLTLADPTGFVIDDELARGPLAELGWRVDALPWDRPGIRWQDYEIVVIRSTWDYYYRPEQFVAVLAGIEASGTPLENRLALVRWNLQKSYLRELELRGVPIAPTLWRDRLQRGELAALFAAAGGEEAVIKPVVGAGAVGAWRLERRNLQRVAGNVEDYYQDRPLMLQPFASAVLTEGEYSLFWFNGTYSHAIVKVPQAGDFRVQEEHGGDIRAVTPEASLRAAGERALAEIGEVPLYARGDFVRTNDGSGWWLMELELIEPALYLRMDPQAPQRFAAAIVARAAAGAGPS